MASMASHLEQGYEKLMRWCLNELRQIGREMMIDVDVSTTLQEAIRRLRSRPELLKYVRIL